MTNEAPTAPPAPTFDSLAERLRDGPLRTLLTLHVRAGMLSGNAGPDDGERLDRLVELVELAHVAMSQFHDFTVDVQSLIDELSATNKKSQ